MEVPLGWKLITNYSAIKELNEMKFFMEEAAEVNHSIHQQSKKLIN